MSRGESKFFSRPRHLLRLAATPGAIEHLQRAAASAEAMGDVPRSLEASVPAPSPNLLRVMRCISSRMLVTDVERFLQASCTITWPSPNFVIISSRDLVRPAVSVD